MQKIKTTDILLFFILLALLANILVKFPIQQATAETFKLDDCITLPPALFYLVRDYVQISLRLIPCLQSNTVI